MSIGFNRHLDWDETNNSVHKNYRRLLCKCSFCKPHRNENASRYGKHGKTKPKYKDHRK